MYIRTYTIAEVSLPFTQDPILKQKFHYSVHKIFYYSRGFITMYLRSYIMAEFSFLYAQDPIL